MPSTRLLLFAALPLLSCCTAVAGDKSDPETAADVRLLSKAGLKADDGALLDFFRRRTLTAAQQEELTVLVKQLGDRKYAKREKATATLIKWGHKAKAALIEAELRGDGETARRAQLALRQITSGPEPVQAAAAARLLARRPPSGTAGVLLDYLPFAADVPVIEEVQEALNAAARGKVADPDLIDALDDPLPVKRAAAAEAVARAGFKELRPAVHKLLADPEIPVRLQVALALFEARDREAVPALIALIAALPRRDVWRVEEALLQIAAEKAPRVHLDRDTSPAQLRDAWQGWWKEHGPAVDLARLDLAPPQLGRTLVTFMDAKGGMGNVVEMDRDKKVLWKINDLRYPVDAQILGPDRVLIAEYLGRRVSERDFSGKILWERQIDLPIAVQRLPGGQTFIATRKTLIVTDRDGKDVFTYQNAATSITAARRLRNGQTVFVVAGRCIHLDADGKQIKSFPAGPVYTLGGNIDVLPNGRVLVPEYSKHRVVEYDGDGKVAWSVGVKSPISAERLPNGNTLVTSMALQRVTEYDREGREVWSHTVEGRVWRARRR